MPLLSLVNMFIPTCNMLRVSSPPQHHVPPVLFSSYHTWNLLPCAILTFMYQWYVSAGFCSLYPLKFDFSPEAAWLQIRGAPWGTFSAKYTAFKVNGPTFCDVSISDWTAGYHMSTFIYLSVKTLHSGVVSCMYLKVRCLSSNESGVK